MLWLFLVSKCVRVSTSAVRRKRFTAAVEVSFGLTPRVNCSPGQAGDVQQGRSVNGKREDWEPCQS